MKSTSVSKPVERLFPFALRARIVVPGRETLWRMRRKLHFLLLTTDLSAKSREQIARDFAGVPVMERFTAAEIEGFFGYGNTKVLGFTKSSLAASILRELRAAASAESAPSPVAAEPDAPAQKQEIPAP
jgi:hypothetical protein